MGISSFRAGEAISAGDAIYLASNGLAFKGLSTVENRSRLAGVALDAGPSGSLIRTDTDGVYDTSKTFTPGVNQFLSHTTAGDYETFDVVVSGIAELSAPGVYLTKVGRALSTSVIDVELSQPVFLSNPTSVFLLENDDGLGVIDAILQEDSFRIDLETA